MVRAMAFIVVLCAAAPSAQSPRDLFERARMLEESNTRLADAAALYAQVAADTSDRHLAATAQFRIGLLHERLGRKEEAIKAFAAVTRLHADQREIADRARARLAHLSPTSPGSPSSTVARLVWGEKGVDTQGAVSPDGQSLSYVEHGSGQLMVRNLATGQSIRLTRRDPTGSEEAIAMTSRFSADGRQIAFAWSAGNSNVELRVAQAARPGSRRIYSEPDTFIDPFGWSPDGSRIFAILQRGDGAIQIASVPTAGGRPTAIKTFDWRWPAPSVSPDGRWLAYSIRPSDGGMTEDLFLLAVDGSRETVLVRHPANDATPIWTPDGAGVVFVSDRSGTQDAWYIPVADGQPTGPAVLVKQNVGHGSPLGFARDGRLFFGILKQSTDIYIGTIDQASSRAQAGRSAISDRFVGTNYGPDWSPDGTRLLYTSQRGTGGGRSIIVRSLLDDSQTEVVPKVQYFHRPRWFRDGKSFVAEGRPLTGRGGLLSIDPSGDINVLVRGGGQPAWSPDGRTLFHSRLEAPATRVLVARDMATGEERRLQLPGGGEKAVSPDGNWLATQFIDLKASSIRLAPTDGGPARTVITLAPPERVFYFGGLSWTPDGKGLLFVKQTGERRELCRVDVATGRITPTGLSAPGMTYVRLHPDGKRLAYSAGTRQEEVWVIENFLPPVASARR
jgi:Tol biopolymer transport system component